MDGGREDAADELRRRRVDGSIGEPPFKGVP